MRTSGDYTVYEVESSQELGIIIDVGKRVSEISSSSPDIVYSQNSLYAGKDNDGTYHPIGHVIKDGVFYQHYYKEMPWSMFVIPYEGMPYITRSSVPMNMIKLGFYLTPQLVSNGVVNITASEEGTASDIRYGSNFRSAIGVLHDGKIILVTTLVPYTLTDLAELMVHLGCVSAGNMDGGGSVRAVDKKNDDMLPTSWERYISSAVVVKGEKDLTSWKGFRVTSPYGMRKDPFTGANKHHSGIDLVKGFNTPIESFTSGEVVHAKMGVTGSGFGNYGNVVAIKDKDNHLHCYCHLNSINVKVGDIVKKGDIIGREGNTGRSTGSHLHYEVRNRTAPSYGWSYDVDPVAYLNSYVEEEEIILPKVQRLAKVVIDEFEQDAYLINDTTYVPIRFVTEKLGGRIVHWDNINKIAYIEK